LDTGDAEMQAVDAAHRLSASLADQTNGLVDVFAPVPPAGGLVARTAVIRTDGHVNRESNEAVRNFCSKITGPV
jgi:hypothetical protein